MSLIKVQNIQHTGNSNNAISLASDSSVSLKHSGNAKIETDSGGVTVTGNITVSGTVDNVDLATRDTLFGGLTASSGVLTDGVTATTQSASDNSTKVATTAYTDTAISNLVNSAPSTLDTLGEIATALNNDAALNTTLTNSIATKLPLAGGTITGSLTVNNTVSDGKGNLRSIPLSTQSNTYTLVAADAGKAVYSSADVTIPNSVFSAGDAVTIINNSSSNMAITQGSGLTIYLTADGTTGNRALSGRGMATLIFIDASTAYISGAGLS
tara:strand:- start:64 stop:870 length:807 start_codon:yes stop_codon:yes gene_type:complete